MGRRYSKALMALALEKSEPLVELHRELEDFSCALAADEKLMHLLTNPNVLLKDRITILDKVLDVVECRPLVTQLCRLLIRKGRLTFLCDIAEEFQKLVDVQEGVVRASVESARQLTPDETETIKNILHSRFNKRVVLTAHVDPDLIGGVVIRVGSQCFDGSIRSQLKDIQNQLLEEVPS
jgi:F-type H+-transporting ATPase subunit delta